MTDVDQESTDSNRVWESLTDHTFNLYEGRLSEALPGLVHYTNFRTLEGIIANNEIWFSPVAAMNDFSEIRRGKHLIQKYSQPNKILADVFSEIEEFDQSLWTTIRAKFLETEQDDYFSTFASCWSTCRPDEFTHDNLTMWRGYASDGNGVAIVIDPLQLQLDQDFRSDIIICPVWYESEEAFANRASTAFKQYLSALKRLGKKLALKEEFQTVSAFIELCFYLAVTHKHRGFLEEKEWRFVWRRHRNQDARLASYIKPKFFNKGALEYFCLKLEKNENLGPSHLDTRKLIKEVMIGPTDIETARLRMQAVTQLLRSKNFDLDHTRVSLSQIPYRSRTV